MFNAVFNMTLIALLLALTLLLYWNGRTAATETHTTDAGLYLQPLAPSLASTDLAARSLIRLP